MFRTALLAVALVLPGGNALAQGGPPPGAALLVQRAHQQAAEREIRKLLVPFLAARKAEPFDAASLGRFLTWEAGPSAELRISDYEVVEVRVYGSWAEAFVKVKQDDRWWPEVEDWVLGGGEWRVADPVSRPFLFMARTWQYHDSLFPKPRQDPSALALVRRAAGLLSGNLLDSRHPTAFRVRLKVEGEKVETLHHVCVAGCMANFMVSRMAAGRGRPGMDLLVWEVLETWVGESFLPDPRHYHLALDGADTVIFTGFSPGTFLTTVRVRFGPDGLPSAVTENPSDGFVRRVEPRYVRCGDRYLPAGGVLRRRGLREETELTRYARWRGRWAPTRISVTRRASKYVLELEEI